MCSLFLEHRVKVDARQPDGHSALHLAAAKGCAATVKLLLMHGADCRAITPSGHTALHLAARSGSKDVIAVLLNFDPDLDLNLQATGRGFCPCPETPLVCAAAGAHAEVWPKPSF